MHKLLSSSLRSYSSRCSQFFSIPRLSRLSKLTAFSCMSVASVLTTATSPASGASLPSTPSPTGAAPVVPLSGAAPPVPLAVNAAAPNTRPGLGATASIHKLGLLSELSGTWVGSGFNIISLPAFTNTNNLPPALFRLKLSRTMETITFTPIGGSVPNRGSVTGSLTPDRTEFNVTGGQSDTQLSGLSYLQRVSDAVTNEALHVEPGFWLNVPPSDNLPVQPAYTVARLASVPHGDSIIAQGGAISVAGGPVIASVDSTPTFIDTGKPLTHQLMGPFHPPPLPTSDFKPAYVTNLNLALLDVANDQVFEDTVVLIISSASVPSLTTQTPPAGLHDLNKVGTVINLPTPTGAINNIPFVQKNANATRLDAIFWIESVKQDNGDGTFSILKQLQYTQTVNLVFNGINWPHISVATLTKQ